MNWIIMYTFVLLGAPTIFMVQASSSDSDQVSSYDRLSLRIHSPRQVKPCGISDYIIKVEEQTSAPELRRPPSTPPILGAGRYSHPDRVEQAPYWTRAVQTGSSLGTPGASLSATPYTPGNFPEGVYQDEDGAWVVSDEHVSPGGTGLSHVAQLPAVSFAQKKGIKCVGCFGFKRKKGKQ